MPSWICRSPETPAAATIAIRIVEARLNELESKIGLAEDLLDALNRTVYRQQQQIDQLQQEVRALRQQLREAAPPEALSPGNEMPPHY
jgi:SlyX protein